MGGSWERLVRSIKTILPRVLLTRNPTDEMLRCMLTEVENIINSRPLAYIPIKHENDEALTPNHFLVGSSNGLKPLGLFTDDGLILRKNFMMAQLFRNIFWNRWTMEVLPDLTRRTKWFKPVKPIEVGDVVVIVDERNPAGCWPKGRVIQAIKGSDNQVRRAIVQTASGVYERPATKLAVLDVMSIGTPTDENDDVAIPGGSVGDGNTGATKTSGNSTSSGNT